MRVFVTGDEHYSSYLGTEGWLADTVAKANDLAADLYIHIGDILDNPLQEYVALRRASNYHSYAGRVNFYNNTIKPILNNFTGQYGWLYIAGNHEMSIHAKAIVEAFGYWYKQVVLGDVLFLLLNTNDSGDFYMPYVGTRQLWAIKQAIDTYSDKICIALGHVALLSLTDMREAMAWGDTGYAYGYDTVRNAATVVNYLNTHPRFAGYGHAHWSPAAAGYDNTTTPILQVYKRHHQFFYEPSPGLKDSFVIDINTVTGQVDWNVWKYDTNTLNLIISVTV
ncbi:MAG: metallophosphoesterase [Bacillota bacterium]